MTGGLTTLSHCGHIRIGGKLAAPFVVCATVKPMDSAWNRRASSDTTTIASSLHIEPFSTAENIPRPRWDLNQEHLGPKPNAITPALYRPLFL